MVHRVYDPELDEKTEKKTKSKIDQDILGIVLYFFSKLTVLWYTFMVERVHVPALGKVDRTLIHLHGPQGT